MNLCIVLDKYFDLYSAPFDSRYLLLASLLLFFVNLVIKACYILREQLAREDVMRLPIQLKHENDKIPFT